MGEIQQNQTGYLYEKNFVSYFFAPSSPLASPEYFINAIANFCLFDISKCANCNLYRG